MRDCFVCAVDSIEFNSQTGVEFSATTTLFDDDDDNKAKQIRAKQSKAKQTRKRNITVAEMKNALQFILIFGICCVLTRAEMRCLSFSLLAHQDDGDNNRNGNLLIKIL